MRKYEMRLLNLVLPLCALSLFIVSGCDNPAASPAKPGSSTKAADKHDHDHDHDHKEGDHDHKEGDHDHKEGDHDHKEGDHDHDAHGPNGGHMFELTPNDLSAEWTHSSSNNIIKVFILNKDGKANETVKCDKVVITPLSGNNTTPFELPAVEPKDGASAEFMLDSKDLNVAMTLGVKVEIKVGDKTYSGKIAPHAPHDH
jgi:uncharacterized protein involved in copper resistance